MTLCRWQHGSSRPVVFADDAPIPYPAAAGAADGPPVSASATATTTSTVEHHFSVPTAAAGAWHTAADAGWAGLPASATPRRHEGHTTTAATTYASPETTIELAKHHRDMRLPL